MTRFLPPTLATASLLVALLTSQYADAALVPTGNVGGVPTYLDTNTGKVWTVTLGRVRSDDWGKQAAQHVAQLGFRLPTFQELQGMYNYGNGGGVLGIRNGLLDYYETRDPNILGNALATAFRRRSKESVLGTTGILA